MYIPGNIKACGISEKRGQCIQITNNRQQWRLATYESRGDFNYCCGLNDNWVFGSYCQYDPTKFLSGGKCEYNSCNIINYSNKERCLGLTNQWLPNSNELISDINNELPQYYYMDQINSIRNRVDFKTYECNIMVMHANILCHLSHNAII